MPSMPQQHFFHTISISFLFLLFFFCCFYAAVLPLFTLCFHASTFLCLWVCTLNAHVSHFFFACEYIKSCHNCAGKMKNMLNGESEYAFKVFSSWWLLWHGGSWGFKSFIFSLTYARLQIDNTIRTTTTTTEMKSKQTNTTRTRISNK